jgi:hypothetical protein
MTRHDHEILELDDLVVLAKHHSAALRPRPVPRGHVPRQRRRAAPFIDRALAAFLDE